MPYVSPVLRVDIGQGEPVMAYRDRLTGEVTELRSARLDSAKEAASRARGEDRPEAPSTDRADAAQQAYQQTAANSGQTAQPVRPTALSLEA